MFSFLNKKNKVVAVSEIDSILKHINLIDIREAEDFKQRSIKKSKNIPMVQLLQEPDKHLNKEKEYHIICYRGGKSTIVCNTLRKKGYNVINVEGGFSNYTGKNLK